MSGQSLVIGPGQKGDDDAQDGVGQDGSVYVAGRQNGEDRDRRAERSHVVPVWFTIDDAVCSFSTSSRSVKARNIARDPRVSVAVDDEAPPFAFVSIRGRAELIERPGDFLELTARIATRYVGAERGPEKGQLFVEIDDLLVRVRIDSFIGRAEVI